MTGTMLWCDDGNSACELNFWVRGYIERLKKRIWLAGQISVWSQPSHPKKVPLSYESFSSHFLQVVTKALDIVTKERKVVHSFKATLVEPSRDTFRNTVQSR